MNNLCVLNELLQVSSVVVNTTCKTFPRCILLFVSVRSMKAQLHFLLVSSYVSAAGSCWHLAADQGSHLSTPLTN